MHARREAASLAPFEWVQVERLTDQFQPSLAMPVLTFEILCDNEEPIIADVLTLPGEPAMSCRAEAWLSNERAIWCRVEALALRIGKKGDSAFIRVRNSDGTTVVLAGVATALASIEKCSCVACPLKRELKGRVSS